MPALVRKVLIFAAVEGLVLQPLSQRSQQRAGAPIVISYKSHAVSPLLRDVEEETAAALHLDSYGIIGLLTLNNYAYLISISRRTQVAQIWGKPIYVVTGIAIIPLVSQAEAQQAIKQAKKTSTRQDRNETAGLDVEEDSDNDTVVTDDHLAADADNVSKTSPKVAGTQSLGESREPGIVEDVIANKGGYGRFADRWFSRRGWTTDYTGRKGHKSTGDRKLHDSTTAASNPTPSSEAHAVTGETLEPKDTDVHQRWPEGPSMEKFTSTETRDASQEHLTTSLLPKLIRTTKLLFNSKTFYFSYDHDISHRLGPQRRSSSDVALYKQFDPQYFWNQNLAMPFIHGGFHELVLPVMQGFVGQRSFLIDLESMPDLHSGMRTAEADQSKVEVVSKDPEAKSTHPSHDQVTKSEKTFLLTVISRRSVRRSGLRYLRRGIDEDGNTANAVETEQVLSSPDWNSSQKISSFVQFRGSMPLFFSQTPYTFKPVPVLFGTVEVNQLALRKHFTDLIDRYGKVQAVSLVDRHGNEAKIGESYEENVRTLNDQGGINGTKSGFTWFEFHHVCRGMKFENVSVLVDEMSTFLNSSGWTTSSGGALQSTQTGVIRTNCMDCLDRTNVCQSAFGQYVLELQLASLGHSIDLRNDPTTAWFNTLWADNGDAISRAYAGTAALKGDYTRTRKRNAIGALTDLSLTLSRYYRNLFEDFFAQSAIDYLLGTVTVAVFSEFEATMTTADPAMDIRKARQSAITNAAHVVIEDESEDLVHGWALAMPASANSLRSFPFEEIILLLTDHALYAVRFDWTTDKVRSFERIDLSRVNGLKWGTYITETNAPAQMDAERNVGLVMRYSTATRDGDSPTVRVNTRSLENVMEASPAENKIADEMSEGKDETREGDMNKSQEGETRILAFKALPLRSAFVRSGKEEVTPLGERQMVSQICAEIARVAMSKEREDPSIGNGGEDHGGGDKQLVVEEGDVISVEEAKRTTGVLEKIGYSLKKLVWG